jgi:cation diffusion facilitator family transporter
MDHDGSGMKVRGSLTRFAWLSVVAALVTMALKGLAWWLTGSVGLLSDALESTVNLAGALMAVSMLALAARPADEDHPYGHGKAEYFASGFEGGLILIAAVSIAYAAVQRLLHPVPLEQVGLGLALAAVAALVNLGVALVLLRAGRRNESITLRANAHHLLTDVWTTAGVVLAVAAVNLTGWLWLDPLVALAVAANIVWAGWRIVGNSVDGLMDRSLPDAELAAIRAVLDRHTGPRVRYHALRTRQAGRRRFISLHVLVPATWSVRQGHQLLEQIEADLCSAFPNTSVLTHLEPLGDPAALNDLELDRN